jgi:hypothetical protein
MPAPQVPSRTKNQAVAVLAFAVALGGCASDDPAKPVAPVASAKTTSASAQTAGPSPVERVRAHASALATMVTTKLAGDFLAATSALPEEAPRILYEDKASHRAYSADAAAKLDDVARAKLTKRELDYYETKYGSPLAYARPVELLGVDGLADVAGKKIVDFGYGGVGQLRLFASLGARAVGVDVDPVLPILYGGASDTGAIAGVHGAGGTLTLLDGRYPFESKIRDAVGSRIDVFLSKNTLKRGYIHPERPVAPGQTIDLGMNDDAFLAALFAAVKPGGRVLVFNICPKQAAADAPYVPWADGRSPFDEAAWKKAGFAVVYFDRDETAPVRSMAHALGWDVGDDAMDLEHDLFAWATLVHRP